MKQLICFFVLCCTACTTAKYPQNNGSPLTGTTLAAPTADELARKYYDPIAESYIEIGTPDSFRRAVAYLSAAYKSLTAEKKIYLSLATKSMMLLYPLESSNWQIQSFEKRHEYLDAFEAVVQGKYPQDLGMNTFLATVLPTFILVQGTAVPLYEEDIQRRLNHAAQLNPKSVLPHYLQGLLYERQKKFLDAEAAYKIAWDKDNSCYPAGMQFCRLILQRYSTEEVLEITRMLAARFPGSIEVQTLMVHAYCAAEHWDEAVLLMQSLLPQANTQPDVFFLQIRILIQQKKYLQATRLLDSYAKKNKTEKRYLLLRTQICRKWTRNTAEAYQYLSIANDLYPYAADVLFACAELCFENGGDINGNTVDDFISFLLQQDPNNVHALRLRIKQDSIQGDWVSAFDRAEALYESDPAEENQLLYIAACIHIKKWKLAVKTAASAYAGSDVPSTALIALYLEALFGAKSYQTLRNIIVKKLPEARTELRAVLLYYQALMEKNSRKKLSLLRLSLLADPRNKQTLFALYEWYYTYDDYKKAHYYLQQVIAFEPSNPKYLRLDEKLHRLLEK